MADRALVTGLGVVAPNGVGAEEYWSATLAGKSGLDRLTQLDARRYATTVGGVVSDFVVSDHVPGRLVVQTDRWTQLGLAATGMALNDAGIDPAALDEYELGVVTASASGGNEFGQREIQKLWSKGPQHVGAYQSIAWFYAATTGQVSIRHGARGPCGVVVTEQASGLDALAQARRAVRTGTRVVISGGTEAPLSPYALVCQSTNGMLSASTDPLRSYAPFDADACGYVPGEGGAILIVESAGSAGRRGVPGYGEVAGYAATFDPKPGSGRPPTLRRAAELALADAGLSTSDIDVVFADAAGVPELDAQEAAAIAGLFGPYAVPVTAPKSMTGRLYAGGASLDVATALLAIRDAVIPPTVGVTRVADDYRIDLVTGEPREAALRTALVLARGTGGFNAAMVVRAVA
jgi:minimal PKS chain-length factor (CLF/KS beta)